MRQFFFCKKQSQTRKFLQLLALIVVLKKRKEEMNCHCVSECSFRETGESPAKNDISVYSEIVDLRSETSERFRLQ